MKFVTCIFIAYDQIWTTGIG